eukprot:242321_1
MRMERPYLSLTFALIVCLTTFHQTTCTVDSKSELEYYRISSISAAHRARLEAFKETSSGYQNHSLPRDFYSGNKNVYDIAEELPIASQNYSMENVLTSETSESDEATTCQMWRCHIL